MIKRFGRHFAAFACFLGLAASPAQADVVAVTGIGTVGSVSTQPPGPTNVTINAFGQTVGFLVTFDTASVGPPVLVVGAPPQFSLYTVIPISVIAGIGGHVLTPPPSAPLTLVLRAGVVNFGSGNESVLFQTFQFNGLGGATSPVQIGGTPVQRDVLSFTSIFRTPFAGTPTIADLRDPSVTPYNSFFYRGFNNPAAGNPFGLAQGGWSGRFVPGLGGVPEPATWAFMILGFGVIGGAMRRRAHNAGSPALSAA